MTKYTAVQLEPQSRNSDSLGHSALPVSVIVAVRNEAQNIGRLLDQILGQDFPVDQMEIIVADGMSTDSTGAIVAEYSRRHPSVRLLPVGATGRSQGLNAAIRSARGELIVRLDARSEIEYDYISRCLETIRTTGAWNVGGCLVPRARTRTQAAIGFALRHPFGVGDSEYRLGKISGFVPHVYLGCFRREVFDTVGYFDEEAAVISEDTDLNRRIIRAGGTVYLNSEIRVYYYPRETLGSLLRLYFRYGGSRAGYVIKHRSVMSIRQVVAPGFLLFLLSGLVVGLNFHWWGMVVLVVAGIYSLGCWGVAFGIGLKERSPALIPRIAACFPCMHLGWAAGFWKRLLVPERAGNYWRY